MRLIPIVLLLLASQASSQTLHESVARGKAVYDSNCIGCHGADGKGTANPGTKPLDGSQVVLYDTAKQVRKILDGVRGTAMPSWAAKLTDQQIADVVSFTKNQWSNNTGVLMEPITITAARSPGYSCFQAQFLVPRPPPFPAKPVSTEAGTVLAYWCALPTRQGDVRDRIYWSAQGFVALHKYTDRAALIAAAGRVGVAADSYAQLVREIIALQTAPTAQDAYEIDRLQWLGCEALRTGPPPNGIPFDNPLPADFCGAEPLAPSYHVAPWPLATYRATFPLVNGVRGTKANGRVPILTDGQPTKCSCATAKVVEGSTTYCSVLDQPATVAPCRP